jgi:nucleoid DNA-binding protein
MNYKDFIQKVSTQTTLTKEETEKLLETAINIFLEQLTENKSIGIQGFGTFELRKKEERIIVHPATKKRLLMPPKLTVHFKSSNVLKEKLNNQLKNE